MRYLGLLVGFLAVSLVLMPGLGAQDKKDPKKDAKEDKKEVKEKDEPEKKDPPKKEKKPVEELPEHGAKVQTKIVSMKADSARDLTVEIPMPDPQKMFELQRWQYQQQMSIAQARNPQEYAQRMAAYQQGMAGKNTFTMKNVEVRANEACKVRIMYPPIQYDDAGNLKKWTKKEIADLKAGSKLPGFPADFDMLKTGQYVQLYMAKQAKGNNSATPKKKKMDDDPDPPMAVPEVVMIVIFAEPMGR